jgi:hypothetical protein
MLQQDFWEGFFKIAGKDRKCQTAAAGILSESRGISQVRPY